MTWKIEASLLPSALFFFQTENKQTKRMFEDKQQFCSDKQRADQQSEM